MKIDRARALMFVGVLAASGCVITTDDNDNDDDETGEAGAPAKGGASSGGSSSAGDDSGPLGGEAGEGPSGTAGESGSNGGAGAGSGGSAGAGAADDGGSGGDSAPSGGKASTGGAVATGGAPTTGGTTASGAGGEGGAGLICDDSEGELPNCDEVAPDPSCESIGDFQRGKCESAALHFKPRIAAEIQYCITLQTPEELCDATLTYTCADQAIRGSCPDDDAALDACAEIATSCETVDLELCLTYLSAMTATGKSETVACMVEGLFCDLYSCAEGL